MPAVATSGGMPLRTVTMGPAMVTVSSPGVAMRRRAMEKVAEQHARKHLAVFLFECFDHRVVGIVKALEGCRSGFVDLLGMASVHRMIVEAHDFINGLVKDLELFMDGRKLGFGIRAPVMEVLKERHAGEMDFAKAGAAVKNLLG